MNERAFEKRVILPDRLWIAAVRALRQSDWQLPIQAGGYIAVQVV